MLEFIGLGSAFNTELGNTSAFIKNKESMILIDCGGTVFHRIKEMKLLDNTRDLNIVITHTHPDHVGSLGEVIFYAYHILKIKTKLYYPDKKMMNTFLSCIGVEKKMVDIIVKESFIIDNYEFQFLCVDHIPTVKSYGFIINNEKEKIYYSGDANEIPKQILEELKEGTIKRIYQDTCGLDYKGNAHLSLNKLEKLVPKEYRDKVYCIHLDEHIDLKKVQELGFCIPQKNW